MGEPSPGRSIRAKFKPKARGVTVPLENFWISEFVKLRLFPPQPHPKMFANVLRTQARFGVLRAARVAVPATRSLSSLISMRVAAPVASRFAVRAFNNSTSNYERPRNPPSDTIFVGNVPWETTKEELAELFSDFGTIAGEVRMRKS